MGRRPAARHGLAGQIVAAIEPHTEADPAALLLQVLAAFGSAAGRSAHDVIEDDGHYANLYCLLVGQTWRARKGTSWGRVRRLFHAVDERWVTSCIASGLTSGEGLVARLGGDDEESYTDKRLLIYESEFARVLKVVQREGNALSALIREAWDRGTLQVLNKNSPLRATGAHVSIIAHITVEELKRLLNETEMANGFGNRFLLACVRRSRLLPRGGALGQERLAPLVVELRSALEHARRTGRVAWIACALKYWDSIDAQLTADRPGLAGALCARAEAQVVRLAVIYALLDRASAIDTAHVRAAAAVWEYCKGSIEYLYGGRTGDPAADAILAHINRAGGCVTRWQLRNALGRNYASEEITRALAILERLGRITKEVLQTGGRHAEVLRLYEATKNTKTVSDNSTRD